MCSTSKSSNDSNKIKDCYYIYPQNVEHIFCFFLVFFIQKSIIDISKFYKLNHDILYGLY